MVVPRFRSATASGTWPLHQVACCFSTAYPAQPRWEPSLGGLVSRDGGGVIHPADVLHPRQPAMLAGCRVETRIDPHWHEDGCPPGTWQVPLAGGAGTTGLSAPNYQSPELCHPWEEPRGELVSRRTRKGQGDGRHCDWEDRAVVPCESSR